MDVLIVVYPFSGARRYVDELSSFLVKINSVNVYKLHLWSFDKDEYSVDYEGNVKEIYFPYPIYKCNNVNKYYDRVIDFLERDFNFTSKSICHINSSYHFDFGLRLKERCKLKLVFTLHFLNKSNTINCLRRSTIDVVSRFEGMKVEDLIRYDRIICVTEFAKMIVRLRSNFPIDRVHTIYNGFSGYSVSNNLNKNKFKQKLGIDNKGKVVLFVGRLTEDKGIAQLIKAFEVLCDRIDNCWLIVVGEGDSKISNNYLKKVVWTGKVNQKEIVQYYSIADVGVIPSINEQCSYVALEMMNMKLPIVVADIPGLKEIVSDGLTGVLSKVNKRKEVVDEMELCYNLEYLLRNDHIRSAIGENSFKLWSSMYTTNSMGMKVLEVYNDVLIN